MDFFRDFNFTRGVIVLSALASIFLGWLVVQEKGSLEALERQVNTQAQAKVQSIQSSAKLLQQVFDVSSAEGFKQGQATPFVYFTSQAFREVAKLGDVDIKEGATDIGRDLVDRYWTIQPPQPKAKYNRQSIANYLYLIEQDSRRVKVTSLQLRQVDSHKAHEYIDDNGWTYTIKVTSREAKDS